MTLLLGLDEAGYGPSLGPLVVAATLWRLPHRVPEFPDLYDLLEGTVVRQPFPRAESEVPIADSKQLYQGRLKLARLETGLFPALAAWNSPPTQWSRLWPELAPESGPPLQCEPWYREYDAPLPRELAPAAWQPRADALRRALSRARLELPAIRAVAVFPTAFNRAVARYGSKGALLSHLTIRLARDLLDSLPAEDTLIVGDKHGGRNRYGPLLQTAFPDDLIQVRQEGRALSVYRWGAPGRTREFQFAAGGEAFLPAALASMVAKYLREMAMQAFNAYWQRRIPGLRPTAGYPQDARRFWEEIDPLRRETNLPRELLWRAR